MFVGALIYYAPSATYIRLDTTVKIQNGPHEGLKKLRPLHMLHDVSCQRVLNAWQERDELFFTRDQSLYNNRMFIGL